MIIDRCMVYTGSYSVNAGSSTCSQCPGGTSSTTIAATNSAVCVQCASGMIGVFLYFVVVLENILVVHVNMWVVRVNILVARVTIWIFHLIYWVVFENMWVVLLNTWVVHVNILVVHVNMWVVLVNIWVVLVTILVARLKIVVVFIFAGSYSSSLTASISCLQCPVGTYTLPSLNPTVLIKAAASIQQCQQCNTRMGECVDVVARRVNVSTSLR